MASHVRRSVECVLLPNVSKMSMDSASLNHILYTCISVHLLLSSERMSSAKPGKLLLITFATGRVLYCRFLKIKVWIYIDCFFCHWSRIILLLSYDKVWIYIDCLLLVEIPYRRLSNVLLISPIINEYIRWEGLVTLVERWISGAVVASSRPGVGLW